MTLPPPTAINVSHRSSCARAVPWRINSTVGSLATRKPVHDTPAASSSRAIPAARAGEPPVTSRTHRPIFLAAGAISRTDPGPKTIRPALANSKRMALLPTLVGGEDVGVLHAATRLGHHRLHRVTPCLIVSGLLVLGGRLSCAVHLDEDEAPRVVRSLDHVEPGDTRFPNAVA